MFERFQRRSYQLERLDTGDYTAKEYARWQREMKFVHGVFGENRALKRTLFKDIEANGTKEFSALDVGAGSGGLMLELRKWASNYSPLLVGAELDVTAARTIKSNALDVIRCDALLMPFADDSFDYVFCSLFLHHLGDEAAVSLIAEMARVAAKRIYVIDLNRHPTAYYFYKFFGRIFLQRFTIEDGSLSILRSFNPVELRELAKKAGLGSFTVKRSKVNRLILSGHSKK